MLKPMATTAALLLVLSTLGCASHRSETAAGQTSGQSTAGSGSSANASEQQIMDHLKSEGLSNIHLAKQPVGWTANATTPDFRPVTLRLDERGNVLGARSY